MKVIIIIAVIVILYIFPAVYVWIWTKKSYSKNGIFEKLNAKIIDILEVIVPFFNLGVFIACLSVSPTKKEAFKKENKKINYNKFFNIKK